MNGQAGTARPDASMQLLRDVMDHPLDPAYALAAAHSSAGRRVGRTAVAVTLVVAALCGWLATRAVGELRRPEPGLVAGRAGLEREIKRRELQVDAQHAAIGAMRAQIAAAQQITLKNDGGVALAERAQALALVSGELPVTGPGIEITLRNAPPTEDPVAGADPRQADLDPGRVQDRDLQNVVNALWAAGAEAIAINQQRLTSLSAIRSAGQAILVDFRALTPPYVIDAIADSRTIQSRFAAGTGGPYLQVLRDTYGVGVGIAASSDLTLPGAGTLSLHKAKPARIAGSTGRLPEVGVTGSRSPSTNPRPSDGNVPSSPEVVP